MLLYSEYVNKQGPFPQHDTEYVQKLRDMKNNINKYDEEPVTICKHCKSLHIMMDEEDNNVCHRCGSINEIEVIDDIKEYENRYGKVWKIVHPTIKRKK